ncbi:MAG: hypothetical protein ACKPB2_04545 [Sphaerospermopsis kisseleviana]
MIGDWEINPLKSVLTLMEKNKSSQSPVPSPQSPVPSPQSPVCKFVVVNLVQLLMSLLFATKQY